MRYLARTKLAIHVLNPVVPLSMVVRDSSNVTLCISVELPLLKDDGNSVRKSQKCVMYDWEGGPF